MKDSYAVAAASAAALVASAAKVLDLGDGYVEGDVVIDVSAMDVATTDEIYTIVWQLSPDATFGTAANVVEACQINLGAAPPKITDSNVANVIGRYILPVRNEFAGTIYRYARLWTVGSIAGSSITYTAFLGKR